MKSMILAVDREGGIGFEGGLPWPHIAEDMAWFRHVTMQHKRCIMGRKTWESIGKLKGRDCYVVTSCTSLASTVRNMHATPPTAVYVTPPPLEDGDIVIGGASLYEHYADQVDVVFLTEVNGVYESDVKVDLEYLLKDQLLRGYTTTEGGHFINVYARELASGGCASRNIEHADRAMFVLECFGKSIIAQDGDSAPELESSVNSPEHYKQGGIEAIEAIGSITVGYTGEDAFCAGNVVKYIARAPFKGDSAEDLKKALWYLKRLIASGGDDDC